MCECMSVALCYYSKRQNQNLRVVDTSVEVHPSEVLKKLI
jgi:hypothetical protein